MNDANRKGMSGIGIVSLCNILTTLLRLVSLTPDEVEKFITTSAKSMKKGPFCLFSSLAIDHSTEKKFLKISS